MSRLSTFVSAAVTLAAIAAGGSQQLLSGSQQPLVLTHGIASGDVTDSSAVIWARASGNAQMHVEIATNPTLAGAKSGEAAHASPETDFTAQLTVAGLEPDTRYWYRVWLAGAGGRGRSEVSESAIGAFKTAPAVWQSRPVSFVVGADVGGQRFCRNVATGGYSIFASMAALAPDFFIANGDMIYADGDCPADGPDGPGGWENIPGDFPSVADPSVDWTNTAQVREVFLRHWRYNRADPYQQTFLRSTSMYSQWDDHEVINDFGAPWTYWNSANISRAGYPNLVAQGLDTFFAYAPIDRSAGDRNRIYRSFRWGSDVELYILDARSYRDRNEVPDTPQNDKDMLGREQIAWLVEGIRQSTATWKIVSSDVPISIGTGSAAFGRDAWANIGVEPTGFERELLRMLAELDSVNAQNVVFVTTDVHHAQTIAYDTDADGDGDRLVLHELVSGPLNAVRNAAKRQDQLDTAANPTSLFGAGGLFNFNYVSVSRQADGKVHLIADVRNEAGLPLPGSRLDLTPR
jgi:alkaline phosphatase D